MNVPVLQLAKSHQFRFRQQAVQSKRYTRTIWSAAHWWQLSFVCSAQSFSGQIPERLVTEPGSRRHHLLAQCQPLTLERPPAPELHSCVLSKQTAVGNRRRACTSDSHTSLFSCDCAQLAQRLHTLGAVAVNGFAGVPAAFSVGEVAASAGTGGVQKFQGLHPDPERRRALGCRTTP